MQNKGTQLAPPLRYRVDTNKIGTRMTQIEWIYMIL